MIDNISAVFQIAHEPFGDIISNTEVKTKLERRYRKRKSSTNRAARVQVKSKDEGQSIEVSGNYAKFLQGHNIFGSNNLRGLCVDVLKVVTAELGLSVSKAEMREIMEGNFAVERVDIAANFRASSSEEVPLLIREIERHWRDQGKNVSNYGQETVYLNQHDKNVSLKFYDKRTELRAKPLPKDIAERDRLLKYAEKKIRAELTLRSAELKRRGLDRGFNWTIAIARELIFDAIESSGIEGQIKRLLLPEEYGDLDNSLKQVYRLWLHGDDVRSLFGYQTYRRRQIELKRHGIDIGQPQPKERVVMVDIRSCLTRENMAGYPRFAKEHGLIHLPS